MVIKVIYFTSTITFGYIEKITFNTLTHINKQINIQFV